MVQAALAPAGAEAADVVRGSPVEEPCFGDAELDALLVVWVPGPGEIDGRVPPRSGAAREEAYYAWW